MSLLAAAVLALSVSTYGIGLSNDSVAYWAAANSFYSEGIFFLPYRDTYFTDWPPLFSIFLSTAHFLQIDNKLFFYSLQVVGVYFTVLCIIGTLAYQFTKSRLFSVITLILFITAPPTFFPFSYLWTETYFILFTIMFVVGLDRYLTGQGRYMLFFCITMAALSILVRYAGIVNIATGCLILFFYGNESAFNKLKRTLLFGILSCIPLLLWLIRNFLISSTFTGEGRTVEFAHLKYSLVMVAKAVWEWFLPYPQHPHAGILTIILLGIAIAGIGYFVYLNFKQNKAKKALLLILLINSVLSLLLIFFSSLFQSSDFPDARLTSPAFFSFLLILVCIADHLVSVKSRVGIGALLLFFGVTAIYNFNRYYSYSKQSFDVGVEGLTDQAFYESEIISDLQSANWLPNYTNNQTAFSNLPEILYFRNIYGTLKITKGFRNHLSEQFEKESEEKLIIWIGDKTNLEELIGKVLTKYTVDRKKEFSDGVILWLKLKQKPFCM